MALIRIILGKLILFFNWAFPPKGVKRDEGAAEELLIGGGDLKVPCLRIEDAEGDVRWLYESGEIVGYLEGRFLVAESSSVAA